MPRITAILDYWFGELDAAGLPEPAVEQRWFTRDDTVDAEIRARFEADLRSAAAGRLRRWEAEARGALALVLLFDQFPRNMYRDTPRAFLFDEHARAVARRALEAGHAEALRPIQRVFLYMPFEHAEDPALQEESVQRFGALVEAVPEAQREHFRAYLAHAEQHRDVIARFGRFPHRNALLGRESTAEEQAYLDDRAPAWGQRS
ncbi:MAG: DUF924 family protein [Halofilum sp. (in: g-proteobacteria)]|nr:DUF924 family protein [Halofilum sp. (in: g-proteobacteria)]